MNRSHPPALKAAAVEAHLAGLSLTQAAAKFGTSKGSVHRWVVAAGHVPRERPRQERMAPFVYKGGWVRRGLIQVPIEPQRGA